MGDTKIQAIETHCSWLSISAITPVAFLSRFPA
jgi:hypothetical protein